MRSICAMTSKSTTARKPAKDARTLKKRVRRFLAEPKFGADVSDVVTRLSELGRVALFGGALRDLALHGRTASPRDIDIVVECEGDKDLGRHLAKFNPRRNRFGGFRFRTEVWSFDVWRVQDTWAVREGLVNAKRLDDLVHTTFFDWDALLYETQSESVTALPHYFDRLASPVVDINLVHNPNPLGTLVRALRILVLDRACLGKHLIGYTAEQLGRFDDGQIAAAEWKSFRNHCLRKDVLATVRIRVASALDHGESAIGGFRPTQLELNVVPDSAEQHDTAR
jgi:hypothetical protein